MLRADGPLMDFRLDATLRLASRQQGGREGPLRHNHRASWDLGNTWLDVPTFNDARVLLADGALLPPGGEGPVQLEPASPEHWGRVRPGLALPLHEGPRVLGVATIRAVHRDALLTADCSTSSGRRGSSAPSSSGRTDWKSGRGSGTRGRLLELYRCGLSLPLTAPPAAPLIARAHSGVEGWAGFGAHDSYREVRDPFSHGAPVGASLSGDLLDIFQEAHAGLHAWDAGRTAEAIWQWRYSFERWGARAVDALRALHSACAG
jgi:hypothetical protein